MNTLSVNQIADRLQISNQAIYNYIKKNNIQPVSFLNEGKNKTAVYNLEELPRYAKLFEVLNFEVPETNTKDASGDANETIPSALGSEESQGDHSTVDPPNQLNTEDEAIQLYTVALEALTPELINSYVWLFGIDGAKNILKNHYGINPNAGEI